MKSPVYGRQKQQDSFLMALKFLLEARKYAYFFASFLSHDEAFNIISGGWLQHCNGANASTEQQEAVSESSSQENGSIAIEKVNSSETVENESPATNLSKDNSSKDGECSSKGAIQCS